MTFLIDNPYLFFLAVLPLSLCLIVVIGWPILGPLDLAARHRKHPPQYTLLDFLCLVFLLQLPTGVVHSLMTLDESPTIWILDTFGWVTSSLMWWWTVRTLSRAGVREPWHRALVLVFVLPVAFFGSLAFAGIGLVLLEGVLIGEVTRGGPPVVISLLATEVILGCAFYFAARFTRRVVSTLDMDPHDGDDAKQRGVF